MIYIYIYIILFNSNSNGRTPNFFTKFSLQKQVLFDTVFCFLFLKGVFKYKNKNCTLLILENKKCLEKCFLKYFLENENMIIEN